ncbi:TonB-dependent receptor [Sphingobium sp. 3R8]|uniref:TonB-dependent receptor n=1 Tax=Sphingobium sp. 3R8 TaxID=2874921 RepID=UPI001CCAE7EC|nr:TonB-dependent receptor [Sphingobium sp. 3R8]MBZ9649112.1 TonB-dependent receptor [Sphingobium sp. 3R8]
MNVVRRFASASHIALVASATVATMLAGAQGAAAQVSQARDAAPAADEIVVTAQKRAERLQDVPLAVTAVTSDALAQQNINDTSSLVRAVPSLQFQPGATSNGSGFRIRGIGSQLFSLGVEASVSVVVDGVVAARQAQSFADFADIERIEVLRGPQGTLFGKNATGGVINIITARPKDSFGGSFDATVAEMDEYRIKGTITGPIAETLNARVSGYYNNVGGYIRNQANGKDVNKSEGWGLRGKLDWQATPDLNFLLAADYRKNKSDCCNPVLVNVRNPDTLTLIAPVTPSIYNRRINEDEVNRNYDRQFQTSLEASWDLGAATVTSITAYQKYKNVANNPTDKLNNPNPIYIPGNGVLAPGLTIGKFDQNGGTIDLDQFSQELRVASNGQRDLGYVFGLFYSDVSVDRTFLRAAIACPTGGGAIGTVCANPVTFSSSLAAHNQTESIAGFGQIDWRVVGGLKLIGGLRVQHESTSVDGTRTAPAIAGSTAFPGNASISGKRSASDTAVTGKAGVQYEFSRNAQVYASFTRGYKGLGFNTELATNFATQEAVQPEHVNGYELGFKGRTADGLLSVAVAGFIADYTDLQVLANRSDPSTGQIAFVQTNAGSSQTKGVEIEAALNPAEGLSVNFGMTYAKTRLDADGLSCPLQVQAAAATNILTGNFPVNSCYRRRIVDASGTVLSTSGPLQDVRGGELPFSPKLRLNVSPRYEMQLNDSGLSAVFQIGLNYQSKQRFALEQDPLLAQKGYALVDTSIGLKGPEGRWYVTGYVRNLFDKQFVTSMAHSSPISTAALPFDLAAFISKESNRYFGVNFGMKF